MKVDAITTTVGLLVAAALVLPISFSSARADEMDQLIEELELPQFGFIGEGGFAYQGEADIDGGGHVQVNRFDVGFVTRFDLLKNLRLNNAYFFGINDYDFGGGGFGAVDPWNTILSMRLAPRLTYLFNEQWGIFGGDAAKRAV